MTEPPIIVCRVPTIAVRSVEQRERDASNTRTLAHLGDLVPLHSPERDDNDESIESESTRVVEPEAKTKSTSGASPDEVGLDEIMAKLKAAAARAEQLPPSRTSNKRLVTAAAIALSITSGSVTGQYLIFGHSRAPAAPSKASAAPALSAQALPASTETTEPAMVQAAPPPAPLALEPAARAEPQVQAIPDFQIGPAQPDAQAATQSAAISEKKPAAAAKAHHPAPPTAATHSPPAAQGNAAGPVRVQFGAFANEANARHVQWAIEATGLKVEVNHNRGPSGNPLFFVRSPTYPDRASAMSAAQTAQSRAQHLVNPVRIDYTIIPERAAGEQQAQL